MAPRVAWLLLLALPALVLPAPASAPQDAGGGGGGGGWGAAAAGALAALALLAALAAFLLGCAWCHRYKNCKLFGAGARARRASARAGGGEEAPPPAGGAGAAAEPAAAAAADAERGPVYLVRAPDNNNAHEDNNNGPISFREMQNIENNNAAVYIVSENENRNGAAAAAAAAVRASRESVVEFEPLPANITPAHAHRPPAPPDTPPPYADWFVPPVEEFPRDRLQYLREIGRGSFGRIVEGEVEGAAAGARRAVAVRVLERGAGEGARARFLRDAHALRDARHENVLALLARNLAEEPWLLIFDLCDMDLQQYLLSSRPRMAELCERGVPLRLQCDVAAGLAYLHSLGRIYGSLWSGGVLVCGVWGGGGAGGAGEVRARLGHYGDARARVLPPWSAPEIVAQPALQESSGSEVWSLGVVLWEVCAGGEPPPPAPAPPPPPPSTCPCLYRDHLYQVMQLCWQAEAARRPTAEQVRALLEHLRVEQRAAAAAPSPATPAEPFLAAHPRDPRHFEERWQRLKPNSIPKLDEHVAPAAASRSSSIHSDTLHPPTKSDSLTNLHGSFEDVRNADYLALANGTVLEPAERERRSPAPAEPRARRACEELAERPLDPWLEDIMARGEDPSFCRDVGDVIESLDSILSAERTSSSESSHQASPSRERLALQVRADCLAHAPSCLVKSPAIADFQSVLDLPPPPPSLPLPPPLEERDEAVAGPLRHSYQRTPEATTPDETNFNYTLRADVHSAVSETNRDMISDSEEEIEDSRLVPTLKDLCAAHTPSSVSNRKDPMESKTKDCQENCDNDKLFKPLGICPDFKSESVIAAVEPLEVQIVTVESKSMHETDRTRSDDANTIGHEVTSDEPAVLESMLQVEVYSSPRDKSDGIEEESFINSVSDTEVLSADNDSTVYMDLKTTNGISEKQESTNPLNKGVEKDITKLCSDIIDGENNADILSGGSDMMHDSTHYLELPQVLRDTSAFLHAEKAFSVPDITTFLAKKFDLTLQSPCNVDNKQNNILITSTPKTAINTCSTEHTKISNGEDPSEVQKTIEGNIEHIQFSNSEDSIGVQKASDGNTEFTQFTNSEDSSEVQKTSECNSEHTEFSNVKNLSEVHKTNESKNEHNQLSKCEVTDSSEVRKTIEGNTEYTKISNGEDPSEVHKTNEGNTENIHNSEDSNEVGKTIEGNIERTHFINIEDLSEVQKTNEDGTEHIKCSNDEDSSEVQRTSEDSTEPTQFSNIEDSSEIKKTSEDNTEHTQLSKEDSSRVKKTSECNTEHPQLRNVGGPSEGHKSNESNNEHKTLSKGVNSSEVRKTTEGNTEHIQLSQGEDSSEVGKTIEVDVEPTQFRNVEDSSEVKKTSEGNTEHIQFKKGEVLSEVNKTSEGNTEYTKLSDGVDSSEIQRTSEGEDRPNYGPRVILTRLEQRTVPNDFSSPACELHSLPAEEDGSVILGPFENCTLDYFTGIKTESSEQNSLESDLPKEELLAFSSNFVELNLNSENASFKMEPCELEKIPDIQIPDEHFQDNTKPSFSPTTPPNSPGNLLSNSPRHEYAVGGVEPGPSDAAPLRAGAPSPDRDPVPAHLDVQLTSKLAQAENENNLNMEVWGLEGAEEATPPGAGADSHENSYREGYDLDEECVRALRNELQLKLPLAQATSCELREECPPELPPPPTPPPPPPPEGAADAAEAEAAGEARGQLVLCYPGALSPILEETDPQLSAYHSNLAWNLSQRTDSSESYPEPCNNSTDDITDLFTAMRSAQKDNDTLDNCENHSDDSAGSKTFTIHKEDDNKEMSMSADSLNGTDDGTLKGVAAMLSTSVRVPQNVQLASPEFDTEIKSPINTEIELNISQVSPYLLSPTADSSKVHTESNDNVSNVSKLSKPTLPSCKSSKASDTQCLSKVTSMDSWCSNDTLFNVEDNFDELVMDSDLQACEEDAKSSTTLTEENEAKSKDGDTYIIHDSKSDKCDSFTPDSISANYTYTKVNKSLTGCQEENNSEINRKSSDIPAFISSDNDGVNFLCIRDANEAGWESSQDIEQLRRSPLDHAMNSSIPVFVDKFDRAEDSPLPNINKVAPIMRKIDSIDITCLKDDLVDAIDKVDAKTVQPANDSEEQNVVEPSSSPERHYKGMANSVTSTPLLIECMLDEQTPNELPSSNNVFKTPHTVHDNVPDFATFVNSAELRPQEMSPYLCDSDRTLPSNGVINTNNSSLTNGSNEDIKYLNLNIDPSENAAKNVSSKVEDKSSGYSEFQSSVKNKDQDISSYQSNDKNPTMIDSSISSANFLQFERSAQEKPQELSSVDTSISAVVNKTSEGDSSSVVIAKKNEVHAMKVEIDPNKQWNVVGESKADIQSNVSPLIPIDPHFQATVEENDCNKCLKTIIDFRNECDPKHDLIPSFVSDSASIESSASSSHLLNSNNLMDKCKIYSSHVKDNKITVIQETGDVHTYIPIQTEKSGIEFRNDDCPDFSTFECSAQFKPQELSNENCSNLPNISNINITSQTAEFLSFERSALAKPQDLSTVLRSSIETSPSSQNFNNTFETYDSHKTQRQPKITIIKSEETPDKDPSHQSKNRSDNYVESDQSTQSNDNRNGKEKFQAEDSSGNGSHGENGTDDVVESILDPDQIHVELCSNQSSFGCVTENVKEVKFSEYKHELQNSQQQGDLEYQELTEHEHDSLICLNDEIINNSDATHFEKEISSATSTVEESEPTTKEMDSLDNNLEIVDEVIVHGKHLGHENTDIVKMQSRDSALQDRGHLIERSAEEAENDHDIQIVQAIEELDQILDANCIDNDSLSDSPSTSPSEMGEENKFGEPNSYPSTVEICSATNNFIENEKNYSEISFYLPLLNDIRFTGPSSDYMSTSFKQECPEGAAEEEEDADAEEEEEDGEEGGSLLALEWELQRAERNAQQLSSASAERLRDWESESEDSHTNSTSSGEFIWKDGEGQERCLTTTTDFDDNGGSELGSIAEGSEEGGAGADGADGSEEGSGSEDEAEFVPSAWDCRAAPAKSSMKTLDQSTANDGKKRVVFKRQKYHCVYEYPRELSDDCDSLYQPDYSTYAVWEGGGGASEFGGGYASGAPHHLYQQPTDTNFSPNYGMPDEDFFISSSARPFESLGIMSTTSQFFPGLHATLKAVSSLERADSPADEFPPPPSPLASVTTAPPPPPPPATALDFTTPDSGVEDVTPGSTLEEEARSLPPGGGARPPLRLRAPESSTSSSESASPSSPCWEALGGLRHTRDRLKLDLPPSPSPLHLAPPTPPSAAAAPSRLTQRVFNFLGAAAAAGAARAADAPVVMTDETPVARAAPLPLDEDGDVFAPEPTFSTFGKSAARADAADAKPLVLSDERDAAAEVAAVAAAGVGAGAGAAVRGEGTVLDSGDEDSGIESSAKTTLERLPPRHTAA